MHVKATLAVVGVLAASTARAQVAALPEPCRPFTWLPADVEDDTLGWNQLLSLASCLQDASIERVSNADELAPMIERFQHGLAMPMMIYLRALEEGPGDVQLRAAYQVGMAEVALIVRARSSLANPSLRSELEAMLARPTRFARMTFEVMDRAVDEDPTLASDPITRAMVRSARGMLRLLPRSAPAHERQHRERGDDEIHEESVHTRGSAERGAGIAERRAHGSRLTREELAVCQVAGECEPADGER